MAKARQDNAPNIDKTIHSVGDNIPLLQTQQQSYRGDGTVVAPLSHYIDLNRRYARSINVERDLDKRDAVRGYVPTERSLNALQRILPAIVQKDEPTHRAWTMTGVYGTGKSAFAHYLLALCGSASSGIRQEAVAIAQASFPDNVEEHQWISTLPQKGLIRAAAAGQREPLAHTIARALVTGANSFWRKKRRTPQFVAEFIADWSGELYKSDPNISDHDILNTLKRLILETSISVFLVLDELGKNLEFAAHHQGTNDLYLLQQIAEMDLDGAHQVYFLGILHQSFAGYSERLTAVEQNEWNKIQGRFEDIVFTESPSQMTRLIGQVIVPAATSPLTQPIHQQADQWFEALQSIWTEHELSTTVLATTYPLHPVTALVLPLLCVRYAQSDRSLFTFLTSDEPHGLKAFLNHTIVESHPDDPTTVVVATLQLHQVYDYFVASASGMATRSNVQRWVEIQSLVEDAQGQPTDIIKVFKTIGILNLITTTGQLRATPELVALALCQHPQHADERLRWQTILDSLLQRGLLTHRRQLDELRLWQGSDFNVEFAIQEQIEQNYAPLAELLNQVRPLKPIVAQRHYTTTGTLRYFEQRYGDSRLDLSTVRCSNPSFDGLMIIWLDPQRPDACLPEDEPSIPSLTANRKPLVVMATTQLDLLRIRARECQAMKKVLQYPELDSDKVASKEVKHRLAEAEQLLDSTLAQVLSPLSACQYWVAGEPQVIQSDRQFQSMLSDLCDRTYHRSLILDNELINRRELTSQGAKARRELIEAMLEAGDQERLGLDGYGPEVAMYYSVLGATQIHRQEDDDVCGFYPPTTVQDAKDTSVDVGTVWEAIESFCLAAKQGQRSLDQLYTQLSHPPYGVKSGVIPILLAALLLYHMDDVGIYKDGTFIPVLGPEHFELLVKDPSRFSVKYFEIVGLRSQVFRELERILRSPNAKTPEGIRNASLLVVARPLFSFVKKLPKYTLNTTRISTEAQHVLKTLQKAQEPDELLFVSLPEACGFEAMYANADSMANSSNNSSNNDEGTDSNTAKAFRNQLVQCLHEIQTAYDCLLAECQERLHEVFGVRSAQEKLREDLRVRAQYLRGQCIEPVLKRFVIAAADETTSDQEWLEALMMIVVDKPPKAWRDHDITRLDIALSDLVRRFQNMEALQKEVAIQGKGFEAVRITQTESNGDEIHEVVPIELSRKHELEALADRMLKEALICDNSRLQKEFVAILNRRVFESRSTAETDDLSTARQQRQQHQLSSM